MGHLARAIVIALGLFVLVVGAEPAWIAYTAWRIADEDPERDAAAAVARGDWRLLRDRGRLGPPGVHWSLQARYLGRCGGREVPLGDVFPMREGEQIWFGYAAAYNRALLQSAAWEARCDAPTPGDSGVG